MINDGDSVDISRETFSNSKETLERFLPFDTPSLCQWLVSMCNVQDSDYIINDNARDTEGNE